MAIASRRNFIKQSGVVLSTLALPYSLISFVKSKIMENQIEFDVIIIGGSYSGLAAGMALGRAMRKVLIIDSNLPCNRQTPHSHNFLTHDGEKPHEIAKLAKMQVESYSTVKFFQGLATRAVKLKSIFEVETDSGKIFTSKKLIFATGIKDILPSINGFDECWGISVLHCPYCHGYEVRNQNTGVLGNGTNAFDFSILISNWTKELKLFTNGKSTLTAEQTLKLERNNIQIIELMIEGLEHDQGHLNHIILSDETILPLSVLYAPRPFEQHSKIPESMGCELTDEGYIKVNAIQKTSVDGVFACGDNTTRLRTVANAVALGTTAGMMVNKEIVFEEFD